EYSELSARQYFIQLISFDPVEQSQSKEGTVAQLRVRLMEQAGEPVALATPCHCAASTPSKPDLLACAAGSNRLLPGLPLAYISYGIVYLDYSLRKVRGFAMRLSNFLRSCIIALLLWAAADAPLEIPGNERCASPDPSMAGQVKTWAGHR